ncbi:MAG: sigma-54-dependent Fis family transcriptional regulator [Rhizobacter sp.]|nr:sigma-54-dependent Fis family transcriptional regulator [Bacteriovorax sp.]
MTNSSIKNLTNLENLSSTLFLSLDEAHFFLSLNVFFKNHMNAQKVQVYKILDNGSSVLMAEDGQPVLNGAILEKGVGASGYIGRTKRGYFSNTVERDPVFTREAGLGVKAELCFPISADGVVLGSIHCQMMDASREFSREDMTFGMSVLTEIKSPIMNMKMYLTAKNLNETLLRTIELKEKELQESRSGVKIQDSFKILEKEIIGRSASMKDLLALVDRICDKDINAFVMGEAATGKEMIARRIHCRSHRRDRAFVTIDCSTMNETQLDKEMFGTENHMGMLEVANFGTLFINSIEKMTPAIQNKLMQYLTSKMGIKAESTGFFKSDVRMISASTKDLMEMVRDNKFREDLYFALSTVVLKAPALRDRKEDIELMANFFLNQNKAKEVQKSFSPSAIKALSEFNWSGNVRELQNVVERAFILAEGSIIEKLHLDQNIQNAELAAIVVAPVAVKAADFQHITLEELEKGHIMGTLENLGGNKTKTAKVLGITVKTLYNKLHSYGVEFDKEA